MISLTEYSQVASISVILLLFTLMLGYILRLVSLDLLNGFPGKTKANPNHNHEIFNFTIHFTLSGGVVRVSGTNYVPRITMEAKNLDWTIKVVSFKDQLLKLEFQLQEQVESLIFRAYWGVDIGAYHQVLRSPWPWFVSAFENANATFGSGNCQVFDKGKFFSKI